MQQTELAVGSTCSHIHIPAHLMSISAGRLSRTRRAQGAPCARATACVHTGETLKNCTTRPKTYLLSLLYTSTAPLATPTASKGGSPPVSNHAKLAAVSSSGKRQSNTNGPPLPLLPLQLVPTAVAAAALGDRAWGVLLPLLPPARGCVWLLLLLGMLLCVEPSAHQMNTASSSSDCSIQLAAQLVSSLPSSCVHQHRLQGK